MKPSPFVSDLANTQLFIKATYAGIPVRATFIDGITITTFGKGSRQYFSVPEVIAWHEREIKKKRGTGGNAQMLGYLQKALHDFHVATGGVEPDTSAREE